MGEHPFALVAIAAAAAGAGQRGYHEPRKEPRPRPAVAADFRRWLCVYVPDENGELSPLSSGLPRRKVNYVVTPFMTRIRHIVFISEMGFDGAEWKNVSEERVEIQMKDGKQRAPAR